MIPHTRIRLEAERQSTARNGSYGAIGKEAWQTMSIDDLASAAKYKIGRATQPQTSQRKCLDDLIDAYNFVAAIYERMLEAGGEP